MRKLQSKDVVFLLWNTLALLAGCLLYAAGIYHGMETKAGAVLKDFGQTLAGSATLFFAFGWISNQTLSQQIHRSMRDTVGLVLARVRVTFEENAIRDYRWDCVLSLPPPEDPYPRYLYQELTISFSTPHLPEHLLFVLGKSNDEEALQEYADLDHCCLRWAMSTLAGELDLSLAAACKLGRVAINGLKTSARTSRPVTTAGGEAVEYSVNVPTGLQGQSGNVAFSFMVRKLDVDTKFLNVLTRLYRNCEDAEFRLVCSQELNVSGIFCYPGEITAIADYVGYQNTERIAHLQGGTAVYSAIIRRPMLPGSNIRFEVRRA